MQQNDIQSKAKLMRVITDGCVFPWHLKKTIMDHSYIFDIIIVGENVSSYSIEHKSIKFIDLPITPKIKIGKDITGLFYLIRLIIKEKPVIIHSIMPKSGLLSALAAFFIVPVRIHTFTGQVWQTKKGLGRFFLKLIDKLIIKLNTICLTDSPSQSKFLYEEGIFDKNKKPLKHLSQGSLGGVDLAVINLQEKNKWNEYIRSQYKIPMENIVIGFLARKTEDKGAILFLDMCKIITQKNKNVTFLFIGPDYSNGIIDNKIKNDHDLYAHLISIGQVNNHEHYLAAFDMLCLPSFREGFGSIVIDAATLQIPTIGSNISGLEDAILHMETGILFEMGNLNQLIESIELLLYDNNLLSQLGKNARIRVLKYFDSKFLSKSLIELYYEYIPKIKTPNHHVRDTLHNP
jgi:glycosyltransferase involved in cell wall biosynthesis